MILITNAPRPADAVTRQLGRLGLPSDCWDGIATSGDAGIAALNALARSVGFVGTAADRAILEARGVRIAEGDAFTDLACIGVTEDRPFPEQYCPDLERWVARDVHMHCLNPDRVVMRGGVLEACAGAIADLYEQLGGRVTWYGKPHESIYRHALDLAGDPPPGEVLALGDGLQTDMLGAARMGFDAIFVSGGIQRRRDVP